MRKRSMLRLFFAIEVMVFGWFYYHGARGVMAVQQLKQENNLIVAQIKQVQAEMQAVETQLLAWKDDSFFKEKIAREELHMAHAGDQIYYFD